MTRETVQRGRDVVVHAWHEFRERHAPGRTQAIDRLRFPPQSMGDESFDRRQRLSQDGAVSRRDAAHADVSQAFERSQVLRHVAVRRENQDRKSTRLNSSHTEIYTLSLHDALPI